MLRFLRDRWFLLVLILVLLVGMAAAQSLQPVAEHKLVRDGVVASVLFMMALPLEPRTIWGTIRRPLPALVALAINYGLLPLTAWALSGTLERGLGAGLLVAATTPCTLASASVWTRRAGGNDTVATMVTLLSNLLCFVLMPLWLAAMMGRGIQSDEFQFAKAVVQLGKLVVLPMVFAQIVRLYRPLAAWSQRHKLALSVLCQCGILYMVLGGAIQTGLSLFGQQATGPAPWQIGLMIATVVGIHVGMLWCGMRVAQWCGLDRADQIAVGFSGSQKTLMIGLKVAMDYGVSILPMVSFHVGQLLVDTLIADRLRAAPPSQAAPPGSSSSRAS